MKWDLSQLVESADPDRVVDKLERMVEDAERFAAEHRDKIDTMSPPSLKAFLEARDELFVRYEGVTSYCSLLYSADTTDPLTKKLNDLARKAETRAEQKLAFLDIALGQLLTSRPELIKDPVLAEYEHYLERIRRSAPYLLGESEERLVLAKDENGVYAWSFLQGEWLSTRMFKIMVDGKESVLPYGQMVGLYDSPDRELRQRAISTVYEELGKDEIIWSGALRAICSDHLQMCEWRHYPSPLAPSLLSNDVEQEAIEALMRTMKRSASVYQEYLRLKARMMGLPKLGNWDIMAPLPSAPSKSYSWQEAHDIIVAAYAGFDRQFGEWVEGMYSQGHIDGEARKGKVSGAFCASWYAGKSAYILQSFNGRTYDLYTQAHELGHAVHDHLAERAQRPSNFHMSYCVAECGSIFGELLLTDHLIQNAESKEEERGILAYVLDNFGQAAFQVSARYCFERSLYDAIQSGIFLDGEKVAERWTKARDEVYGDTVEWMPMMKWEWAMKMHYYIPNFRFYNYPYVFAQLFVFALYRLYKEQGEAFVPRLRRLLEAGSSRSAAALAQEVGFDIGTEAFWQKGIDQAEEFVRRLERTL